MSLLLCVHLCKHNPRKKSRFAEKQTSSLMNTPKWSLLVTETTHINENDVSFILLSSSSEQETKRSLKNKSVKKTRLSLMSKSLGRSLWLSSKLHSQVVIRIHSWCLQRQHNKRWLWNGKTSIRGKRKTRAERWYVSQQQHIFISCIDK